MNLIKITDLTSKLGISSRSLRYYEQVGLIHSIRPEHEKYRYYDEENIERLRQIMVLRKMEIPVKDILRIYESADMSVVVEAFVGRIRAIDEEVDALTELRAVVDDFLQAMLRGGVTKISALPILYEQMEKRLDTIEKSKPTSYQELSTLSDKLAEPLNPAIIELPPMRVLSSGQDAEGFLRYMQSSGIQMGRPGLHEQFEIENEILLRVPEDFANDSEYADALFDGGLYAATNVYLDEDVGRRFNALVSGFDSNKFYEVDYSHASMLENLLSPDEKRELVSLLVPVKKRLPDPALYNAPVIKSKQVAARIYIRDDYIVLRLFFNNIGNHSIKTLKYKSTKTTDGGTLPEPQQYLSGWPTIIQGNTGNLEKTGWHFTEWIKGRVTYAPGAEATFKTNVTFYPKWLRKQYTVRFDANGGTGTVPPPQDYLFQKGFRLSADNGSLKKDHYIFNGWNTEPDGSGRHYKSGGSASLKGVTVPLSTPA